MEDRIRSNSLDSLLYTQKTIKKFYPYKMILIFSLFGISTLFIGLSLAYLFSKDATWPRLIMPPAFIASTVLIIANSITMHLANYAFKKDWCDLYKVSLVMTFVLSLGFVATQYVGWIELQEKGINLQSHLAGSYLFLISGLHALHVFAGLIFFAVFLFGSFKLVNHPATALVYFTDPIKKLRLQLLTIYWHFIDAIWIYLFLFFIISNL